ncbi:hypothetical protein GG344DRAFT_65448 [Lentinula edodes]|nr:hypothetical protein GG344DRAFT_65448 [Lentinula edodes]
MRNKSAVVGIAVGGVVVVVCGILVFTFVMWKRRRRVLWRSNSPDTPYTERPGRVLIRGHSPDGASHPLAEQEWKPSLVSEIGGEDTRNGGREDEDEELYSGQYYQDPVTLPVERDEYGSIMATVYDYGTVDYSDESTSPTVFPRLEVVQEEEEEENEISSTVRHQSKAGEADHEWEQVNAVTSDPFADPEPELKHRQSSASSTPVAISPLSYPKLSNPALIKPKEPNGLREGGNYNAGLSPSSADIAVGSNPVFDPYTLHTHYPDRNPPPHPSPYLLLHPPLRPKLTGSLTDFVSSSSLPSGTLNLPAITVTPLASPGESIDSYHPDGLLDPALLEAKSLQSEGGPRGEVSSESLVDYVDYSRRISSTRARTISNYLGPDSGPIEHPALVDFKSGLTITNGYGSPGDVLYSLRPTPLPPSMNIILFGSTGCGKSSIINMLLGHDAAPTSSGAVGCTFENSEYRIYDTTGLDEGDAGTVVSKDALVKLYQLLRNLEDGITLLKKVPIVLAVTALSEDQEPDMESWWTENKDAFHRYGMEFSGHACITATRGKKMRNGEFRNQAEYSESQVVMRDLIVKHCQGVQPWKLPTRTWFISIVDWIWRYFFNWTASLDIMSSLYEVLRKFLPEKDARNIANEVDSL